MGQGRAATPSTWEPEIGEQETSFGGTSVLHKEYLVGEIYKLIGNKTHQRLEPNLSLFKPGEDGRLYHKGKHLMNRNGELKMIGVIADTLGIGGLREIKAVTSCSTHKIDQQETDG